MCGFAIGSSSVIRLLVAVACAVGLGGTALGQVNFGSRTSGLGNAGGFATGSGLSNGSTSSMPFGQSAGFGFMNAGTFANGGNYAYAYNGNVLNGAAYFGNTNLGPVNAIGPVAPGVGIGAGNLGVGGVGVNGLNGLVANEMALGGGLYSSLYGGVPAAGLGMGVPGAGVAGLGYGVPGINYGMPGYGVPGYGMPGYGVPGVNYAVPGPVVPGATAATTTTAATTAAANTAAARTPRTETFTNNAPQAGAAASVAGAPVVTVHAQQIQEHLARSNLGADFRNVKVLMSGRAVVLRGSVASQAEEQLVLRLVSLEPGVDGAISQLSYPGKIISGR